MFAAFALVVLVCALFGALSLAVFSATERLATQVRDLRREVERLSLGESKLHFCSVCFPHLFLSVLCVHFSSRTAWLERERGARRVGACS